MIRKLRKRLTLHVTNEWVQLFQTCNWYSFTPFHVTFEIDAICNALEFTLTIWGLGLSLRYDRDFLHSEAHYIAQEAWKRIQKDKP